VRPRTIRVRLTALYAGLFLATATILLVAVNLLLTNMLQVQVAGVFKSAKTLRTPGSLAIKVENGYSQFTIPHLSDYELVVLD